MDARTDVYALGCVLYECLVGKAPFDRDAEINVMHAHLIDAPPLLTASRPDLPKALNRVLASALAKSKDDRYDTCGQLIEAARVAARQRSTTTVHRDREDAGTGRGRGARSRLRGDDHDRATDPSAARRRSGCDRDTGDRRLRRRRAARGGGGSARPSRREPRRSRRRQATGAAGGAGTDGPGSSQAPRSLSPRCWPRSWSTPLTRDSNSSATRPSRPGRPARPRRSRRHRRLRRASPASCRRMCGTNARYRRLRSPARSRAPSACPPRTARSSSLTVSTSPSTPTRRRRRRRSRRSGHRIRISAALVAGKGNCNNVSWNGFGIWRHALDGKLGGQRYCYVDANHNTVIVWTHDRRDTPSHLDFIGIARVGGRGNGPSLFNWWRLLARAPRQVPAAGLRCSPALTGVTASARCAAPPEGGESPPRR